MRLVQLPFTSAHCILNNAGTSMLIVELELVAKDGLFRYEISNFVKRKWCFIKWEAFFQSTLF